MKTHLIFILAILISLPIFANELNNDVNDEIRKNNLKVTILSIFSGSLKLTYERQIVRNQSLEVTIGAIGPAFDILKKSSPLGALGRLAYKFIFPMSGQNGLEGWYVKPEIAFSSYSYYNKDMLQRYRVDKMAIMAVGGYQFVFNWFVLDIFLGGGGGIGNPQKSNYHHGFITFNTKSNIVFTAGFKVGVAF